MKLRLKTKEQLLTEGWAPLWAAERIAELESENAKLKAALRKARDCIMNADFRAEDAVILEIDALLSPQTESKEG
jgi:hypothetical protein